MSRYPWSVCAHVPSNQRGIQKCFSPLSVPQHSRYPHAWCFSSQVSRLRQKVDQLIRQLCGNPVDLLASEGQRKVFFTSPGIVTFFTNYRHFNSQLCFPNPPLTGWYTDAVFWMNEIILMKSISVGIFSFRLQWTGILAMLTILPSVAMSQVRTNEIDISDAGMGKRMLSGDITGNERLDFVMMPGDQMDNDACNGSG